MAVLVRAARLAATLRLQSRTVCSTLTLRWMTYRVLSIQCCYEVTLLSSLLLVNTCSLLRKPYFRMSDADHLYMGHSRRLSCLFPDTPKNYKGSVPRRCKYTCVMSVYIYIYVCVRARVYKYSALWINWCDLSARAYACQWAHVTRRVGFVWL